MNLQILYRSQAENLLENGTFPENTAVISFYDPKDDHVRYENICSDVYYCPAEDIELLDLLDSDRYGDWFDYADDLAAFIYEAYNNGKDIICQCDYGESRSAGCAAAISEHFYHNGINIFADHDKCPNKLIYHRVYDALETFSQDFSS